MESPFESLSVVRCNPSDPDPAVDWEAMGAEKIRAYRETRDPALLVMREGTTAVWFTVQRLPAPLVGQVLAAVEKRTERQLLAMLLGVHCYTGPDAAMVQPSDAPAAKGAPFVSEPFRYGSRLAPDAWLQHLTDAYGLETCQELGQVALDLASLPKARRRFSVSWGGSVATR